MTQPQGTTHMTLFVLLGQQLLFQLPNNKLLTTKIGLLSALREHSRTLSKARMLSSTQAK